MQIEPQEVFNLWARRVASPFKIRYQKHSPCIAVGEQSKRLDVDTPEKARKRPGAKSYLKILIISPLTAKSIEWPPSGSPSEAYPLRAPGLSLSRPQHLLLRSILPKSATRDPTGTKEE